MKPTYYDIHTYLTNTTMVYKVTLPKSEKPHEILFNNMDKYDSVGGQINICLWFRNTSKHGNQISFEYNRFNCDGTNHALNQESQSNSKGKIFGECYFGLEHISFIKKCLNVFEKIIEEKERSDRLITKKEFYDLVMEEFEEVEKNVTSI